jgi:hypothetical protein
MNDLLQLRGCLFIAAVLYLLVVELTEGSLLLLLSSCLVSAMLLTLLWRVAGRICSRARLPTKIDSAPTVRALSAKFAEMCYFVHYAVTLADLEFSALTFLVSLFLGTVSCLVGGAWLALLASIFLTTYTRLYAWQRTRVDGALARGREFLVWSVSLVKPPT